MSMLLLIDTQFYLKSMLLLIDKHYFTYREGKTENGGGVENTVLDLVCFKVIYLQLPLKERKNTFSNNYNNFTTNT